MYKKCGLLLLCMMICACSAVVKGESGIGSLMSSIDNYPEDAAPEATTRPAQQTAVHQAPTEAAGQTDIDSQGETTESTSSQAKAEDGDTEIEPLEIINQIEEAGLIVEALTGSGANTISVTYMASDEAIRRVDVFAECQTPGIAETWYSEVANLEIGQTGVFELPGGSEHEYRVCIVSSDGTGFVVLSISTR